MIADPTRDFETVKNTFENLKGAIKRAEKSNTALPDCFVLAQRFENQKEYAREAHAASADLEKKLSAIEVEAKAEYAKLYPIYDRLSDAEMIELLYSALSVLIEAYVQKFGNFGEMSDAHVIEILDIRDSIKILFDELEVWIDRFQDKNQRAFEKDSALFMKLKEFDHKLRDELVVNTQYHQAVYDEAERRLIKKPTGIERFNFWWWHAGR